MILLGELARHDLLWLNGEGWSSVMAQTGAAMVADVARWRDMGWPVVVCRHAADAPGASVTVGLPLPPAANGVKQRLGCTLARTAIIDWRSPLSLSAVLSVARPEWREALETMVADPRSWMGEQKLGTGSCGASPRRGSAPQGGLALRRLSPALQPQAQAATPPLFSCFGSLAMQALTGITYLTPTSDIDILLHPSTVEDLDAGLALLRHHATSLPLDGEIVFPDGAAVSWKEWAASGDERVLVKQIGGVRLASKASLMAQLLPA